MIDDLYTGFFNKFNAPNDFKTAVSGQMFPHKAPQDSSYPFAIYFLVDATPEVTFNTNMENIIMQVSIFDNTALSPVTILNAQQKLWDLFDNTTLTITGYTNLLTRRTGQTFIKGDEPDVWASHTTYEILNFKN